jgi:hypothetical protein
MVVFAISFCRAQNTEKSIPQKKVRSFKFYIQKQEVHTDRIPDNLLTINDDYQLFLGKPFPVSRVGGIYQAHVTPRAVVAPNGDYLLMSRADNLERRGAYGAPVQIFRSKDNGKSWKKPISPDPWDEPAHHQAVPFIDPQFPNKIFAISNHGHPGSVFVVSSDDNGYTWTHRTYFDVLNHPSTVGMAHMRGCVMESGAWLWGIYSRRRGTLFGDRQYLLRSIDKGKKWKAAGPFYHEFWDKFMEGIVLSLGGKKAAAFLRTCGGNFYQIRSSDDGKTWSEPQVVEGLIHPDAPPMVFHLSDKKTLISFFHNTYSKEFPIHYHDDRREIWFARSYDGGLTWDTPRFLCANINPNPRPLTRINPSDFWSDASYLDILAVSKNELHIFISYQGQQLIQCRISERELDTFPTFEELKLKNIK